MDEMIKKLEEEILECEQQIDWLKEHYSSDEEEDNYYDNLDYEIECYENKIERRLKSMLFWDVNNGIAQLKISFFSCFVVLN